MTNYGTIPTSSSGGGGGSSSKPFSNLDYISRVAKDRIRDGLGSLRPWKSMVDLQSLGLPGNLGDAFGRLKTNCAYFRMNYAAIVLGILFLSLLWNPISLIVFIVCMAGWLYLYFLRDEPLVVFGKQIGDQALLVVLSVVTIVLVLLTGVLWNTVGSLLVGVALVLLHGVLRKTEDLFVDEEEAAAGFIAGRSSS